MDNERYFRRGALYGQMDDGERFAFFSKAVVSVLPMLEWRPEVIHCNDWQTALVPIYSEELCAETRLPPCSPFTTSSIRASYGADTVEDLFGLNRGDWYDERRSTDGWVREPHEGGHGDGGRRDHRQPHLRRPAAGERLCRTDWTAWCAASSGNSHGVLNGIDMVSYDPECDPNLPARYYGGGVGGEDLMQGGTSAGAGPCSGGGDTPVLAMVTRLVGHKGVDLVCQALDGIMATGCQLVVLGSGDGGL